MDVVTSSRFWIGLAIVISTTILACMRCITGNEALIMMSAMLAGFGIGKSGSNGSKVLLPLALVLSLSGCGIYAQLDRAHTAVEAADRLALDEFGKRCMSAARACKGRKPEECPGWVECNGNRQKYAAAALAVDESLAAINRLLRSMGVK